MKVMLFGWPTVADFARLEGRMPESWPATTPHHSVGDWLPFTDWCARYWIRSGRVSSVLGLDVRPEIACRISPPLRMAYLTSSRHDLNLSGFLSLLQDGMEETRGHGQTLAASLADTGHQMALELTPGTVEAVMIGRVAWRKWSVLDPVMMEWMFTELASKALYLAIECRGTVHDPDFLPGWVPEPKGPEQGIWKVWKTTSPIPGVLTSPLLDARTRNIRIKGLDSNRKAVLSGQLLTIFHGNATTMLREREAWKSLSGTHPMIPSLTDGAGDLFFQLRLPGDSPHWMPVGRSERRTGPDDLLSLFAILQDRHLLPPALGVDDFVTTDSGTILSRIGFEGYRIHGDPLGLFLDTLASWNLMEVPYERSLHSDQFLSPEHFPSPFRELAGKALSAMSFRDLITRKSA